MTFGAFGTGSFGLAAFATTEDIPTPEARSTISTSRKIDFATGRYVLTDEGGFEGMSDTAQRVLLLTATALANPPTSIDDTTDAAVEAAWRTALLPLTDGPRPAIEIKDIVVSHDRPGQSLRELVYVDLATGTTETVST